MEVELKRLGDESSAFQRVTLPIREDRYTGVIRRLEEFGIGSAEAQDCLISSISDEYPVLRQLEDTAVNIDELDYLAHWLSTSSASRTAAFQALASKYRTGHIEDFINLTGCCYKATVITDFSDLEKIGQMHYRTLHPCAKEEELDQVDFRTEALNLVQNVAGTVTPYDVLYENGLKVRRNYRGGPLPDYRRIGSAMTVIMTWKTTQIDKETFLHLPSCSLRLERALERCGLAEDNRECVSVCCENAPPYIYNLDYESTPVPDWNALAWAVSRLSSADKKKLNAVMEYVKPKNALQMAALAEHIDCFAYEEAESSDVQSLLCYQGPTSLDALMERVQPHA